MKEKSLKFMIKLCFSLLLVTIGLFVLASILPLHASDPTVSNPDLKSDYSEVIDSVLTMLGGGGIGAASSSLIGQRKASQPQIEISEPRPGSFNLSPAYLKEQIDLLKKANQEVRLYCKRLRNRTNNIEDFLIKKYSQEYQRYVERTDKDTIN